MVLLRKSMNDAERYMLLYGPYTPPRCRLGDKLLCEYRGREVTVGGISEANIQWPCAKRKGPRSPILCGDLIRAVKTESEIAIAFHWRVSVHTVTKWRRALDVPRTNQGTQRLHLAYVPERLTPEVHAMADQAKRTPEFRAKIRALKVGRPLHPNAIAAQRKAVSRPRSEEHKKAVSRRMREVWQHPEEHGLPPCHRWTDEEIAQDRKKRRVGKECRSRWS